MSLGSKCSLRDFLLEDSDGRLPPCLQTVRLNKEQYQFLNPTTGALHVLESYEWSRAESDMGS
jgi:hypothetical protein